MRWLAAILLISLAGCGTISIGVGWAGKRDNPAVADYGLDDQMTEVLRHQRMLRTRGP